MRCSCKGAAAAATQCPNESPHTFLLPIGTFCDWLVGVLIMCRF